MIPKIAHFHWEGDPINWLRMMSLYTFARLNPRWEIRLMRTPDHIRSRELRTHAMEADLAWMEAVHEFGGFAMATDTVFVRPIPDEWCDADMCVCTNGTNNFYHCCFGASAGNRFFGSCIDACDSIASNASDYQAMGITLLKSHIKAAGGMSNLGLKIVDQPAAAITPVPWNKVELCWGEDDLPITDETVAVTWFGGAPCSREREWDVPHKHKESAIVKLAMAVGVL